MCHAHIIVSVLLEQACSLLMQTSLNLSQIRGLDFQGAVLDTGAQRSVIGLQQAGALSRMDHRSLNMNASNHTYRFGDTISSSLGSIAVDMPTPTGILQIQVNVVPENVPLLLGIDTMDKYCLQLLTIDNVLEHLSAEEKSWRTPVTRKHGHGYYVWYLHGVLYCKAQLFRLHKHHYHPSTGNFLNLLRRATPKLITADTKLLLEEIAAACHACQTYSSSPLHFQIRTPDDAIFNQEVRIDLVYPEAAVSHI
jgi:hypothetical protein